LIGKCIPCAKAAEWLEPDGQTTRQFFAMIASLVDSAFFAIIMPTDANEAGARLMKRGWRLGREIAAILVAAKA